MLSAEVSLNEVWDAWDYSKWSIAYQRSRRSFVYFMVHVVDILSYVNGYRANLTPPKPPLLEYGWHIYHWLNLIHKYHNIHIRAPRDHWKSMVWSVAFPLWRGLYGDPQYNSSVTDGLAEEKLARLKDLVEKRAWFFMPPDAELRKLVPGKINPKGSTGWATEFVKFSNGGRIDCGGFKKASRGRRPRTMVIDDPHSETQNFSMEWAWDTFRGGIIPMIPEGGYLIFVGTSFRLDDLHHRLEGNPKFSGEDGYQELLPAILDWDKQITLWPEIYSFEQLMARRAVVGITIFNREYLNQAISEELSLYPMSLFTPCYDTEGILIYDYNGPYLTFTGWDLAISQSEDADFTASITIALDEHQNRYIIDVLQERGWGYSTQWSAIESAHRRYRTRWINVEANAYQRALPDELKAHTDMPINAFITGSEKHTLEVGLPSMRKLFENFKYRIPRGDDRSKRLTDNLLFELHGLTMKEGRVISSTLHDDLVMALWLAEAAILEFREKQGWFGAYELTPREAPLGSATPPATSGDVIKRF